MESRFLVLLDAVVRSSLVVLAYFIILHPEGLVPSNNVMIVAVFALFFASGETKVILSSLPRADNVDLGEGLLDGERVFEKRGVYDRVQLLFSAVSAGFILAFIIESYLAGGFDCFFLVFLLAAMSSIIVSAFISVSGIKRGGYEFYEKGIKRGLSFFPWTGFRGYRKESGDVVLVANAGTLKERIHGLNLRFSGEDHRIEDVVRQHLT